MSSLNYHLQDMPLVVPPKVILASDAEVAPVPPFANGRALPLYVSAKVPLVVKRTKSIVFAYYMTP